MSEVKWIEVEVVERLNTMAYAMCVPLEDGENLGHPVIVHPDCLRDAPGCEHIEELGIRRRLLDRVMDAVGAGTWHEAVERVADLEERDALRDRVAELERERDKAPEQCDECDEFRERAECAEAEAKRLSRVMDAWIIADAQLRDHAQARDLPCPTVDDVREAAERAGWTMDEPDGIASSRNYVRPDTETRHVILYGTPDARQLRDALRMLRALLPVKSDEVLRDRVAELERSLNWHERESVAVQRERDAARREAEELRAENERLHDIACIKLADELETIPKDDQPAPQTHYREGDLVESGSRAFRLGALIEQFEGNERWVSEDSYTGGVVLVPGTRPILERDGVPTDEGLRRLAEKAGLEFDPDCHTEEDGGFTLDRGVAQIFPSSSAEERRGLAAALREMGGA